MPKQDEMKYKTTVFMGTSLRLIWVVETVGELLLQSETFLYWG